MKRQKVRYMDHAYSAVTFRDPGGVELEARVTVFQVEEGPPGVGVYFLGGDGGVVRGWVLRWDDGPDADPVVVRWRAPHCADDRCGEPCGHGGPA
jgi:hypothetical protein